MSAIGIVGGAFDPVHYGHLIIAEESRLEFGLDKVYFVPAGIPPHKKDYEVSGAEHRYAMTLLATQSNPFFECPRMEIERPGPSFTVDTIEQFHDEMGEDTDLYFITGADAILEILTWHEPHRLLSMCKLIAATRPGYNLDELHERLPREFVEQTIFLETPGVHISSTELRNRVRNGKSIKYMLPEPVEAYIYSHGLYVSKRA
ncbi:MAG: nicotinate-nucleotide adenylyltransferase [Armatimonadota bacterium]|nr:nicotinate-nucleotide adenylyltransferase [Armatimonadota bacterium]